MNKEVIRRVIERKYGANLSWSYKLVCVDPVVIVAYPADTNTNRREVVPFHVCDYDKWSKIETGRHTGEFYTGEFLNGVCVNCGIEYKPAAVIEQTWKLKV